MSELLIHKKMADIMADMGAIEKDRKNTQQNYNFRGIDDVYNFIQPLMAKHRVFMLCTLIEDRHEERPSKSGGVLIFRILKLRYSFVAEDGSLVATETIGESMDSGDKAAPKAMSIAQKYALLQTFLVPTVDAKDPENDSPEPGPKATKETGQVSKPVSQPPVLCTEGQLKEIGECVSYFKELTKKTDEEIWAPILGKLKAKFGPEIQKPENLTDSQATWLIQALWKSIQVEGQKKIDDIANKVKGKTPADPPAATGVPNGPSGPPVSEPSGA